MKVNTGVEMQEVILVIDTGSSSMKGFLFDKYGTILEKRHISYQMQIEGDKATQDESDFSGSMKTLVKVLQEYAMENGLRIQGISFTSQRSSLVVLDDHMQVLLPVMMWYDRRSLEICREMNDTFGEKLKEISGSLANPALLGPKIRYFQENNRLAEKAAHYLSIQDYLIWLVSGELVTDPTLASRTNLMDIRTKKWSDELLKLFAIDEKRLCRMIPCGSIAGYVREDFSKETGLEQGIPVITAGGDQQCSVMGQMITDGGEAAVTLGSGGYVTVIMDEVPMCESADIQIVSSVQQEKYNMEIGVGKVGTLFNWCIKQFGFTVPSPEAFLKLVSLSTEGANGVSVGFARLEKCMMENRRLTDDDFVSCNSGVNDSDKARAILECIVGTVCEAYLKLCRYSREKRGIRIAGGLAKSDVVCRMMADMAGTTVCRSEEVETTALGAWVQSMAALGNVETLSEAVSVYRKERKPNSVFKPNADENIIRKGDR